MAFTELQQQIWARLGTRSRRSILKTKGRWGNSHNRLPRYDLVQRLAEELDINEQQVYQELINMRQKSRQTLT